MGVVTEGILNMPIGLASSDPIAAVQVIEAQRSRIAELEAQQQWVSVSERLPLEGQDVYLWYPTLPAMIRHFWAEDTTITDVTHWRDNTPPAPPQENTP